MPGVYKKPFSKWNSTKKMIDSGDRKVFGYPREVWWCSLGINIGAEIDGKNDNFERPVIIMKVYNIDTMLVLPTTSRPKEDKFHFPLEIDFKKPGEKDMKATYKKTVYVKLTQSRTISNKRLIRKVDTISEVDFEKMRRAFREFI